MRRLSRRALGVGGGVVLLAGGVAFWVFIRPIFWSVGGPAAPKSLDAPAGVAAFTEVTEPAGFKHVHHKPQLDAKLEPIMTWVASVGAAAAAGDFDNDGWVDLYVTDSRKGQPNHLYRNRGDGTFIDVAASAGVADVNNDTGVSTDCVWGDYDNDGRLDLYVVKWGRDQLFHNNGNGTFTDVTAAAFHDGQGNGGGSSGGNAGATSGATSGVTSGASSGGAPWANGCAAIWVDYDGDGRLDLYVGNYFAPHDLWHLTTTRIMHDSFERSRNAGRNALYHNNGDGTFTDVAPKLGMDDPGWTLGVGHGDINNDGWPDIYCADDFGPDQLFLNNGDGTFGNVTEAAIGYDTKKGMNVDFGDFDGDGWLDVYVTNITTAQYLHEGNMLWHNDADDDDGTPIMMDVGVETQTYDGGWGWGGKFFDFDNDGRLDIIAVNGFITAGEGSYWYDLASWTVKDEDVTDALNWPPIGNRSFSGNEATRLWRNEGRNRFTELARQAGIDDRRDGRGIALFDYDNDGDLDVYLANQGMPPRFYRNDVGATGHWLALGLVGRPEAGSNRDAVGARVSIVTAAGLQIREQDGGNGYCGQSDRRLHFGLGADTFVRTVEIRWPSRRVQVLHDVRADQLLHVEEPADLPAQTASLIPKSRDKRPAVAHGTNQAPAPALPPAQRDALLADLEDQLRRKPDDVALASSYRAQCVRLAAHERSIRFFEQQVDANPTVRNLRLQLATAYVDKIPTQGGRAAIVSKGTLARRSLDQLTALVDADPTWWPAVYARGVNHLHWPRALRHSADAAADFRNCIELQNMQSGPDARSYYVRPYIGLGDALVKDGDLPAARDAWQKGLGIFPNNAQLKARLELQSFDDALNYVEKLRSLEQPIDTDFSFLLQP